MTDSTDPTSPRATVSRSEAPATTFRFALLVALVVVLLASVGLGAWLTATRGAPAIGVEGSVGKSSAELEQVRQQMESLMQQPRDIPEDAAK